MSVRATVLTTVKRITYIQVRSPALNGAQSRVEIARVRTCVILKPELSFFFFSSPLLSHLFYVQQCVPDVLLKWIGRRCRPLTKSRRRLLRPEWRNRPRPTAANLTRSNLAANSDWLANANITTTHSNRFLWIASRVAAVAPMEGGCRCVKSSATAGCTLCRSRRWRTSTTPFAWRSARKIWPSVSDWSTNTPSVTSSKTIWVRKFAFSIRCLS